MEKNNYVDELKDIKELMDKNLFNYIDEIKKIWRNFNDQNKKITFKYLQILCNLAQEYFLLVTA